MDFPVQDAPDAFDEALSAVAFGDIAAAAGPKDAFGEERFVMHGQHEDRQTRMQRSNVPDEFESIPARQGNIREHEIGLPFGNGGQSLPGVLRFTANDEVGLPVDLRDEALAQHGVIIYDQDFFSAPSRLFLFARRHAKLETDS